MIALLIIIYVICGFYMLITFKSDLQMFQQNSYRIDRYWRWLRRDDVSSPWRLVAAASIFLLLSTLINEVGTMILVALACLVMGVMRIRIKSKKPLVFTPRVWRLYSVTAILGIGAFVGTIFACNGQGLVFNSYHPAAFALAVGMFIITFSWAVVMVAAFIMQPVERHIANGYVKDAKRILSTMPDLKVIGITGSYGKTSTKHYLHRILSEQFDVLMTPGSFNTPMGVVRTIREQMKPYNEIFICEMGAKQPKDIKEICDIVNPSMGIITAVGPMHLESFKSIENVQKTKFELADALPADGCIAINNDFEMCASRPVTNTRALRYGVVNTTNCDYWAENVKYSPAGTSFEVVGKDGARFEITTRLLGECNVSDLLAAIVIALQLGMDSSKIAYAIRSIDQVEHRLSMNRTPAGVTIIDDAFNSNPSGSRMAVEVLSHFTDGKRIIVTPGMIELGDRQYELNKEFGENIAHNVDIAIIVGSYNRDAIVEGLKTNGFPSDRLHIVGSFNEAQKKLSTILRPGDAVLYENDLPDTFK